MCDVWLVLCKPYKGVGDATIPRCWVMIGGAWVLQVVVSGFWTTLRCVRWKFGDCVHELFDVLSSFLGSLPRSRRIAVDTSEKGVDHEMCWALVKFMVLRMPNSCARRSSYEVT